MSTVEDELWKNRPSEVLIEISLVPPVSSLDDVGELVKLLHKLVARQRYQVPMRKVVSPHIAVHTSCNPIHILLGQFEFKLKSAHYSPHEVVLHIKHGVCISVEHASQLTKSRQEVILINLSYLSLCFLVRLRLMNTVLKLLVSQAVIPFNMNAEVFGLRYHVNLQLWVQFRKCHITTKNAIKLSRCTIDGPLSVGALDVNFAWVVKLAKEMLLVYILRFDIVIAHFVVHLSASLGQSIGNFEIIVFVSSKRVYFARRSSSVSTNLN